MELSSEMQLRESICEVGRRLYTKNLTVATDGNISVRLGPNRYLCTPSGVSKNDLTPQTIILADGRGERITGQGKVTSEFFTHLAAYEERPDVSSVIHAHPPKAIALTLAGLSLSEPVLPEVVCILGGIPTVPYTTPSTPKGADCIRPMTRQCNAMMLEQHGALTLGTDVFDALRKMEKIEHSAEILYAAHLLGRVQKLNTEQIRDLLEVRRNHGLKGPFFDNF